MAKLPKDARVWYVEKERTFKEKLMSKLLEGRASLARALGLAPPEAETPRPSPVMRALADQLREAAKLLSLNDPNGAYAYCFCELK